MSDTFDRNYWQATAGPVTYDADEEGALPRIVDAVVIGGGYTGLAAAHHLSAVHGARTLLLERGQVGHGASGRNAGMVVPHVGKVPLAQRLAEWGLARTRASMDLGTHAVRRLVRMIESEALAVGYEPAEWAVEAATPAAAEGLRSQLRLYRQLGHEAVRFQEPTSGSGTGRFGALVHGSCASLHPMDLARALAARAVAVGVRISEGTDVYGVGHAPFSVRVRTSQGDVLAQRVIFATNAYTDGSVNQFFRGRVARFRAYLVATAPLDAAQWSSVIPEQHRFATDSRRLVRYWRRLPSGGLLFGGPGPVAGWRTDEQGVRQVIDDLHRRFPALSDVPIEYTWKGFIGATWDRMPHVAEVDGIGSYALGYAGTGVALAVLSGELAADVALGVRPDAETWPLPMLLDAPRFPVPALLPTYPTAARLAYTIQDRRT